MTSTTTDFNIARGFADPEEGGVVLKLRGFESNDANCYFDTQLLSRYAHEAEYLFFWAHLQISELVMMDQTAEKLVYFDMAPLLLYEAIISGSTFDWYLTKNEQKRLKDDGQHVMRKKMVQQKLADYMTMDNVMTVDQEDEQKGDMLNASDVYGYAL